MAVTATNLTRKKYLFNRETEAAVAYAMVAAPRFYAVIGHAIDPERMPSADAALVMRSSHSIAKRLGTGCPSKVVAAQAIRDEVANGRVSHEQANEASALMDLGSDLFDISEVEALVAAVLPAVKRAAHMEAVDSAIADSAKNNGDAAAVAEKFSNVASLGQTLSSTPAPSVFDAASIDALTKITLGERLPTGVAELDMGILKGGLEKQALGVVIAGSGGGKSLFLCHLATQALLDGRDVAYVTLELSRSEVEKRIVCNLAGMTPEELARDPIKAGTRINKLAARSALGTLFAEYQTPGATTPADIEQWLRHIEREHKRKPLVLLVDYADKLVAKIGGTERRQYEEMNIVYERLRDIAVKRDGWTWTAAQTTRGSDSKRKIGVDDLSDSMGKIRIADLALGIPRTEDDKASGLLRFIVPKRRIEEAHGEVGPLVMDAARGRVVVVNRSEPW